MPVLRGIWFELQRLNRNIELLRQQEKIMSQATDNLAAAVQRENTVVSSVTTLISGLAAQIKAASSDPQVQQLADQINANSDTLASAVTANTPAQDQPAAPAAPAPPQS
jgi:ABC-type transporter Mla subunit MlaD